MTVEILRLSGRETAEAEQAASELLDLRTGPRDLSNLLVVDDTATLVPHAPVYAGLDTAKRVKEMLCVAVGPRRGNDRMLRLPGNLGGTQGSPVLWVSDPLGIDWRMTAAAIAIGHPPGKSSGLDLLVELLLTEDLFRHLHRTVAERVPGRVASPGLLLAGADDEAATFSAALAVAIRRLCEPGPDTRGPFRALLPSQASGAALTENGPLARYRDEVAGASAASVRALGRLAGLGRLFRRGDGDVSALLIEMGAALTDLRDLVARLLRDASTTGELTASQRRLVSDAGIRFQAPPVSSSSAGAAGHTAEQSPVHRAVAEAIRGGDTLAAVVQRLTLTERGLKRTGSAGYLKDVATRCPAPLLDRLADPPQRLPKRSGAEACRELGLYAAPRAASALEELVVTVADREWSPAAASRSEVARIRVALDGACKALTEHGGTPARTSGVGRGAQLIRLSENLIPVLRDLVLRVLAGESTQPSKSGQEAFAAARERAAGLLAQWVQHVQADGVSAQPPFASSGVPDIVQYGTEDDVADIREALMRQPDGDMWQLCGPDDLSALNVASAPEVVRFASRLSKDALAGSLSGDQPVVWTSSGSYAGLLRLVPLRSGYVSSSWGDTPGKSDPASVGEAFQ